MILWHVGPTMLIVWFVMRGNPRVDYRIVAVASLLPDIIDKPIGRLLFRERFDSGRLYAHTLLFHVVLFCVLLFMRGRHKRTLTLIPVSSLLHIAEDGVWSNAKIFWWPLLGTTFPRDHVSGGLFGFLNPTQTSGVLWKELIGLAIVAWLFASHGMLSRDGLRRFVRTGMLEPPTKDKAA